MTTEPKPIWPSNRFVGERPPPDGRDWEPQCARCGSSVAYHQCGFCDDGYDGHDCGEDFCCCIMPLTNVVCDTCHGHGGWYACVSSSEFCRANPLPGCEDMRGDQIEWVAAKEVANG